MKLDIKKILLYVLIILVGVVLGIIIGSSVKKTTKCPECKETKCEETKCKEEPKQEEVVAEPEDKPASSNNEIDPSTIVFINSTTEKCTYNNHYHNVIDETSYVVFYLDDNLQVKQKVDVRDYKFNTITNPDYMSDKTLENMASRLNSINGVVSKLDIIDKEKMEYRLTTVMYMDIVDLDELYDKYYKDPIKLTKEQFDTRYKDLKVDGMKKSYIEDGYLCEAI